ncbi:hypothetical protein DPMN_129881 [Dreissena polymorpha]|uniref:Fibrinogen C-terminal domain-containing protein n=1 Tax=Dreissena polymorpha TaxID=45954 RepID=A0A9D4H3M4_DREPO|nr:hypothetical protein DPMN_129881 [Dreissena polymorpha]
MANVGDFLQVFCDFGLGFANYVISIQRYGRVSFVQNYYNYERGFGNVVGGDGWLGLRNIKALTDAGTCYTKLNSEIINYNVCIEPGT